MARKKDRFDSENGPYYHQDHSRPVTRREFLGQGFLAGNAMIMGPSLIGGLFGRSSDVFAQAVDCGMAAAGGNGIPFIAHDLAGGASIAGSNILVGAQDGEFSNKSVNTINNDGWIRLGLPQSMKPNEDGARMTFIGGNSASNTLAFHSTSALLQGIREVAKTALPNTDGVIFCARSDNDTGNNPHNPMHGIAQAGAIGDLVTLIGTRDSDSGGRSGSPDSMYQPSLRPTRVRSDRDARGLADGGELEAIFGSGQTDVMQAIENLSAQKLAMLNDGQMINDLVTCSYQQGHETLSKFTPGDMSPLNDPVVQQVFANATRPDSPDPITSGEWGAERTAAIMKLVIDGYAGAGTIESGGYDYHNGRRTTGERKDREAGLRIGACLEYAALTGKPLMIYVFSDGSNITKGKVDPNSPGFGLTPGKFAWSGDRSTTSSTFILVYNPSGVNVRKHQIGYYDSKGSLNSRATAISNNVDALAQSVVLNYLALSGRAGEFEQLFPNHLLGSSWAEYIAFDPLT